MKRSHIKSFLTGILLFVVSVCMVMTAFAETPITFTDKKLVTVSITLSKTSYALGSEITAQYSISGGSGSYRYLSYSCYGDDKGSSLVYSGGSLPSASSGTVSFTPHLGQTAWIELTGQDSEGREIYGQSKPITLTGGTASTPISIKISFPSSSYQVGNTIKASYQITGGSGSYHNIYYSCSVIDNGSYAQVKYGNLSSSSGTITFTPSFGQSAAVWISCNDSEDRYYYQESTHVTLTGGPSGSTITGNISFNKSSYKPGSPVTAKYSISGGSGSYPYMSCSCWGVEDDGAYVYYGDYELSSPSGTITFTPNIGQYVGIDIFGMDSEGRSFTISSKSVLLAALKKISIKKLTAVSAKKLKVEWAKLSAKDRKKIKYIEVQVSTDKNFSKIVKQKKIKSSKTSWTIPGLKKNTKYYVRIRAYTKSGGDVSISPWAVKSKKTKKK